MQNYVGQQIDRYRITERLGMGGMAVVYKAYDTRLERDVALKLIRTGSIPPDQYDRLMKRFEREAKSQAKFTHRNIVPIYDYGEVQGSPYLVMSYVPGGTLKEKTGQPVDYRQAVQWLLPVADALAYAHKRGVIHRDIKPSNILIDEEGQPVLTDFGIAKILETDEATLTGTGLGVGTPEYMAPEQWQGKATPATDQYALGVVLYELITGQKPYSADTPVAVALMQMTESLRAPSQLVRGVPEGVEKVLYKALAREPGDRYEDMAAFQGALGAVLDGSEAQEPVLVKKPANQPKAKPDYTLVDSEGATRDALEPGPIPGQEETPQNHAAPKQKVPKWALWAGLAVGVIGIGAIVIVGILIGVLRGTPDQSENGEAEVAMRATEVVLATEESTLIATDTRTPTRTSTITLTPTEALGVGSTLINEMDGAEMVYVPAGEFLMDRQKESEEIFLDDFWIYKFEVTNQQYRQCIEDSFCEGFLSDYSEDNLPAVYISWYQATTYCEWAGGRLPMYEEWMKAAWGSNEEDQQEIDAFNSCDLANINKCEDTTVEVGSYLNTPSPYGALDMVGNVWEWLSVCNEHYDYGLYCLQIGGAYSTKYMSINTPWRVRPETRGRDMGLRCVMDNE
jgi:serine/threonine protein kinase/formylglycine-generating enzyme required for sulfatase activity